MTILKECSWPTIYLAYLVDSYIKTKIMDVCQKFLEVIDYFKVMYSSETYIFKMAQCVFFFIYWEGHQVGRL